MDGRRRRDISYPEIDILLKCVVCLTGDVISRYGLIPYPAESLSYVPCKYYLNSTLYAEQWTSLEFQKLSLRPVLRWFLLKAFDILCLMSGGCQGNVLFLSSVSHCIILWICFNNWYILNILAINGTSRIDLFSSNIPYLSV